MIDSISGFELGRMIAEVVGLEMDGSSKMTIDCSGTEARIIITKHLGREDAMNICGILDAYEVSDYKLSIVGKKITIMEGPSV